jgi:hypothetical protein
MITLEPENGIDQISVASVLGLINRMEQIIAQLKDFKNDLENYYPAYTLRALVRHFEAISGEFQEFGDLHDFRYHAILEHCSEWVALTSKISRVSHQFAAQLERYSRKPKSYSWVTMQRRLTDIQILVTNLHLLSVETLDRSDLRVWSAEDQGIVLELLRRPLPSATIDAYKIVEHWGDWLRQRPQIEIGHNFDLLQIIMADLAIASSILQSIHAQFALWRVSLAEVNRYYLAISALEEAQTFLEEIEVLGVGSRRYAQILMNHLKCCCAPLEYLCTLTNGQELSYIVLDSKH